MIKELLGLALNIARFIAEWALLIWLLKQL